MDPSPTLIQHPDISFCANTTLGSLGEQNTFAALCETIQDAGADTLWVKLRTQCLAAANTGSSGEGNHDCTAHAEDCQRNQVFSSQQR